MPCKTEYAYTSRKGIVSVIALAALTVLIVISATIATQSFLELRKSDSLSRAARAQLSAESGISYMTLVLREIRLPDDVDATTFMDEFHAALSELLAPMNSSGVTVTRVGQAVLVSEIQLPRGSFACEFAMDTSVNPPSARLTVTGRDGSFVRRVAVTYACVGKRSSIFDFGVASRGKIVITGSAILEGVNDVSEASVLTTKADPMAILAGGHATITGDLYVTGSDVDSVYLQGGGVSIGGETDIEIILRDHVFLGTQEPEVPEIDTARFIPLATSVIDATTDLSVATFDNILIKAGANPSFPADAVLNGIVYVEAPNKVTFTGSAVVNGLIVTEDAFAENIDDCQIDFRGASSIPGVGALPNTDEFAQIKKYTGTSILAPGFGVTFGGATNSIGGMIAADQLSFRGASNISGEATGLVLGLKDLELNFSGNVTLSLKRQDSSVLPAGFKHPFGLEPQASTYSEPIP